MKYLKDSDPFNLRECLAFGYKGEEVKYLQNLPKINIGLKKDIRLYEEVRPIHDSEDHEIEDFEFLGNNELSIS